LSPFSNTNISLLGAAAAKNLMKPGKPGGVKGAGSGAAAGPAVSDGLAPGTGIRSAQAGLIAQLQQVNQAVNVLQALEGRSSPLSNMLDQVESMIKQGSKNLVAGEMNTAKASMKELVKDMMKGINAPVYEQGNGLNENEEVLAYIGKGFSVNITDGGIVFDINKMLEDVLKREEEQERQDKKRENYRKAMGLVKEAMKSLVESLSADINKAGGLVYILSDINEASGLAEDIIAKIREESSMLTSTHGVIDAKSVMKLLG
jgi:hypothetical protein